MFRTYLDFAITISPTLATSYSIAVHAPGGDARGVLVLPTADSVYGTLLDQVRRFDTDEASLIELGERLFHAIFQGPIKEVYARSQGMLQEGQALRLTLDIAASEATVADLPWEFLYDPDRGPLALLDVSVVRYLPQPTYIPTLATTLPLRVLLTGAQTSPAIAIERELHEIELTLAALGERVQVSTERHLTAAVLQRRLREGFHIWHFVGDGGFVGDGSTGVLWFEGDGGDTGFVSALQLGILLHRSGLRLAVWNASEGARLGTDPFRSIAPALIRAQLPAVVAMQFRVPDTAARTFAGEFYRALTECFPVDACVTEGRKAVMSAIGLARPDWGIPVVYTRAPDGRLFEVPHEQHQIQRAYGTAAAPQSRNQPLSDSRLATASSFVAASSRSTAITSTASPKLIHSILGPCADMTRVNHPKGATDAWP